MLWAGPSELADSLSGEIFDAAKDAVQSQANDADTSCCKTQMIPSSTASPDNGGKHFSIADCSTPEPTSRAQHFNEVAQTLEAALSAVSAVKHGKKLDLDCSAAAQSTNTPMQQIATTLGSLHNIKDTMVTTPRSSHRHMSLAKRSNFDRNAAPSSFATSRSEAAKNAMANLSLENRALRGALNNAVKRLSELEGEQDCLMSDRVFDLVNSVCQQASAYNMAAAAPELAEAAAGPSVIVADAT